MTETPGPDAKKKLILFIIGIAILGTIIALALHFNMGLPAQNSIKAPSNCNCISQVGVCSTKFNVCLKGCGNDGDCKTNCAATYLDACGCAKNDNDCPPYTPPK